MIMLKNWLIGFFVVLLLFTACCWFYFRQSNRSALYRQAQALRAEYVGKEFPMHGITDLNGRPVTRKVFREKEHTIVDFWFGGCGPCLAEMQHFPSYLEENPQLQILSVSIDDLLHQQALLSGQNRPPIEPIEEQALAIGADSESKGLSRYAFLTERYDDWHHLNNMAMQEAMRSGQGLKLPAFPSYFLVDADGKILDYYQTVGEYFYSSAAKFMRDKTAFSYFLIYEKEFVRFSLIVALLVYLIGGGLWHIVRKARGAAG